MGEYSAITLGVTLGGLAGVIMAFIWREHKNRKTEEMPTEVEIITDPETILISKPRDFWSLESINTYDGDDNRAFRLRYQIPSICKIQNNQLHVPLIYWKTTGKIKRKWVSWRKISIAMIQDMGEVSWEDRYFRFCEMTLRSNGFKGKIEWEAEEEPLLASVG